MNRHGKVFIDRRDAGFEVGKLLEKKYKDRNALILGIPRGGVEVAYEVANVLNGELSVVVTKKLPHPFHDELAVGAIAEDGSIYLTDLGKSLDEDVIAEIIRKQTSEVKSRIQRFRKGKPLPEIFNRIVIIVDDGIATGSTIIPAIKLCKARNPDRVIVAAPVSSKRDLEDVTAIADEIVVVARPEDFYAVGQVYRDFHNLSDQQINSLLEDFEPRIDGAVVSNGL
jgi:predicted phosphoribosyltransferase